MAKIVFCPWRPVGDGWREYDRGDFFSRFGNVEYGLLRKELREIGPCFDMWNITV
jgi:hypothetical protein